MTAYILRFLSLVLCNPSLIWGSIGFHYRKTARTTGLESPWISHGIFEQRRPASSPKATVAVLFVALKAHEPVKDSDNGHMCASSLFNYIYIVFHIIPQVAEHANHLSNLPMTTLPPVRPPAKAGRKGKHSQRTLHGAQRHGCSGTG